ncbi:MAG: hypothetical protein JWO05_3445 [Gemmatimonadetes bacterium]|nr:hypothetical protein [Gemmatimonadota bacterium]
MRGVAIGVALIAASACSRGATAQQPAPVPADASQPSVTDTIGLVPPGFGSLRQDDIALRLAIENVQVKLVPLDERVIRTLSPDSYRALKDLVTSRNEQLSRLVQRHGLRERHLFYVTFYGLAPDARFSPLDLTLSASGREFRPLEVLPLSARFGEQRLQPRETQSAIYLFEDGLDEAQPFVVRMGTDSNSEWANTLRLLDRERSLIRSRASQKRVVRTPAPPAR